MRSLRSRLTLSYALLTLIVLSIVAITLTQVVFEIVTRPVAVALKSATTTARAIVAADPHAPFQVLEDRIDRAVGSANVKVLGPPHLSGRERSGQPPAPFRGPAETNLKTLLGIRDGFVPIDKSGVLILPDLKRVNSAVVLYLETLATAMLSALIISWLIARWITAQAIAPLTRVTEELRRFASGDFTPRPVNTTGRGELGELTDAYNGATAQVSAAFRERTRVEEHMRRFVADAGHELRTPLTVISGYHDVLEKGGYADTAIRERAFASLDKETRRMRALVERFMTLARLERPESSALEPVELTELTKDAIGELQVARKASIQLRHADEAYVYADPGELHEAVSNLVDNALKYGEGTQVTVDVLRKSKDVVLRVLDRGPGIAEAERGRIFERFYRGRHPSVVEGSGLGLAIAVRAAERAGGSIRLERADPGATIFALKLPLLPAQG